MSNTPNTSDRLSFTLFLAIAIHALIIFGVTFTVAKSDKVAPTLNITLATHASAKRPDKADFLAQHNQEASGTEEKVKELSTNELANVTDIAVNRVNPAPVERSTTLSQKEAEVIITSGNAKHTLHSTKRVHDEKDPTEGEQDNNNDVERSEKLASLQAKLDQQRQALARKPRITRHTSVSAKSSDEAAYYNQWSQKVLRVGNINFPKEALEQEIFGALRLSVKLKSDGSVVNVQILESSGHKLLDNAAVRIVKLSSPFEPFPPEIRKNTDIFEIIRTWKFEITGLTTTAN